MPMPRLLLPLLSALLLCAWPGCSLRYDADDLRKDGVGGGALGDASLGSPGGDDGDQTSDDGADVSDDDGADVSDDDGADVSDDGDGSGGDGGPTDDGADAGHDDGPGDGDSDDGTDDGGSDDGTDDGGGNPDAGTGNPPIDAGTSEPPIDAAVPPDCGEREEVCCPGQPACTEPWTQCTAGTCKACGGATQTCCVVGAPCSGLLNCVLGLCVL